MCTIASTMIGGLFSSSRNTQFCADGTRWPPTWSISRELHVEYNYLILSDHDHRQDGTAPKVFILQINSQCNQTWEFWIIDEFGRFNCNILISSKDFTCPRQVALTAQEFDGQVANGNLKLTTQREWRLGYIYQYGKNLEPCPMNQAIELRYAKMASYAILIN